MAIRNGLRRLLARTQVKTRVMIAFSAVALVVLIWALPRRQTYLVPVSGQANWPQQQSPPIREIVWQPPSQLGWAANKHSDAAQKDQRPLATPRFSAHGSVLYLSRKNNNGKADIWESHRMAAGWSDPQLVPGINSDANDFGPVLDSQQQHLYFYSDRPGGLGGFDIYVAHRSKNGDWQSPINLGPQINSAADEYDPAISPDHTQLFFATDRTERLPGPQDSAAHETNWTVTIRVRRRAATFDVFRSSRADTSAAWSTAQPLPIINQPGVNDGAPFVSPNGAFLYFASDRQARPNEATNLDLYRARINSGTLEQPENLGPSLNTAAHETEPGLSPEGFTLVFASDRGGQDQLFISRAEEIERQDRWNTSHLTSISGIWWQSILITLVIMAIAALIAFYRGTLWERAYASRFFIGSVAVHLIVLLILAAWTLPKVVEMIVAEVKQSDPISDSLLESERQSHEDGRESYEKVADLDAPQQQIPDQVRQVTQPSSVPQTNVKPLASLPLPRNRPTINVNSQPRPVTLSEAPDNTPAQVRPLTRSTTKLRQQTLVNATELDVQLPEPEVSTVERPIASQTVSLPRRQSALQPVPLTPPRESAASPALRPSRPQDLTMVKPVEISEKPSPIDSPQPRAIAAASRQPAIDLETAELPPQETPQPVSSPAAATTVIQRKSTTGTTVTISAPRLPTPQQRPTAIPLAATAPAAPQNTPSNTSPQSPVKRSPVPTPNRGLPILNETIPDLPITVRDPRALQVAERQSQLPRSVTSVPQPGIPSGANQDPQSLGPARPSANSLERMEIAPTTASSANVPSPLARQAGIATVTPTTPQIDDAVPAILAQDSVPTLSGVSAATTTSPAKASSKIANSQLTSPPQATPLPSFGSRRGPRTPPAVQIAPGPAGKNPTTPLNRAATRPTQVAVSQLSEAPTLESVQPTPPKTESALQATNITLPRTALERVQPAEPASILSGSPMKQRQPQIVGSLAERKNEAPPSFAPRVSLLNRRPARAPRVAFAQDKVGLKSLLVLRQGNVRQEYIEILGGSEKTERAVDLGLKWLADHQDPEGQWSLNNFHKNCQGKHANCPHAGSVQSDTAATGFALLPFLAAGHTHQQGPYQKTISAAAKWLVAHQQQNGDLFVKGNNHHWMYSHGVASMALCELYGMSGDEELKQPAQKSLDFIVASQHKPSGGWRYHPNQAADTSVVGWQLMALKSGEMAGLNVDAQTFQHVGRWLKSVEGNQPVGGLFGYTNRSPKVTMTAEGLLCLQFIGMERNDPRMRAGADYLLKNLPQKDQRNTSYAWYYGSQVMYHMQGEYWEAWNAALRDILVESQEQNGTTAGTWKPVDQWEKSGGRLYASAMKLLILEVYYRHLPLYQQLSQ